MMAPSGDQEFSVKEALKASTWKTSHADVQKWAKEEKAIVFEEGQDVLVFVKDVPNFSYYEALLEPDTNNATSNELTILVSPLDLLQTKLIADSKGDSAAHQRVSLFHRTATLFEWYQIQKVGNDVGDSDVQCELQFFDKFVACFADFPTFAISRQHVCRLWEQGNAYAPIDLSEGHLGKPVSSANASEVLGSVFPKTIAGLDQLKCLMDVYFKDRLSLLCVMKELLHASFSPQHEYHDASVEWVQGLAHEQKPFLDTLLDAIEGHHGMLERLLWPRETFGKGTIVRESKEEPNVRTVLDTLESEWSDDFRDFLIRQVLAELPVLVELASSFFHSFHAKIHQHIESWRNHVHLKRPNIPRLESVLSKGGHLYTDVWTNKRRPALLTDDKGNEMADLGKLFSLQLQLHRYDNGATELELQRYVLTVDAILDLLATTAKYCELPQEWQIHSAPHHFSSKFQPDDLATAEGGNSNLMVVCTSAVERYVDMFLERMNLQQMSEYVWNDCGLCHILLALGGHRNRVFEKTTFRVALPGAWVGRDVSFSHNYPTTENVTVKFVEPDSVLHRKGVRVGQLLKTLNSVPVHGSDTTALEQSRDMDKVEMEFELKQNLPTAVVCYIHDMVAHNPDFKMSSGQRMALWILSSTMVHSKAECFEFLEAELLVLLHAKAQVPRWPPPSPTTTFLPAFLPSCFPSFLPSFLSPFLPSFLPPFICPFSYDR
jgi:hypothetical protein